ncbi:hypothetical protein BV22DRAFT_1031612 [Leucogyrophana mollusca]|uniref:Uncharacterized protein n=1 Tax=Leucogyrophana mollusca TaxID=85980 RepID=A0ACB8BRN9_9AGAM|nr:hypothetical protein BV22DRAFT_1031612 [Leucogyrophana mollusca]
MAHTCGRWGMGAIVSCGWVRPSIAEALAATHWGAKVRLKIATPTSHQIRFEEYEDPRQIYADCAWPRSDNPAAISRWCICLNCGVAFSVKGFQQPFWWRSH